MTEVRRKVSIERLTAMTAARIPIAMVTAYDYPSALLAEDAGIDIAFVGDSLAMLMLGHDSTVAVTLDEMLLFMGAVARGARTPLLLGDLPFGSYLTPDQALFSASRILKEGQMDAVKLEGGGEICDVVSALVRRNIAVMGHIGLTPQTSGAHGGFRVQGRKASKALKLIDDALRLEEAGCFAVVLELVPDEVGSAVTDRLTIPTIGIGSGPHCDGQVLVWHDLLGMSNSPFGRHVRRYADLYGETLKGLKAYVEDVRLGAFPGDGETWHMKPEEAAAFIGELQNAAHEERSQSASEQS